MKKSYSEHLATNRQARNSFILGLVILMISIATTIYFSVSGEDFLLGGLIVWLGISYGASIGMFFHSNSTRNK